MQISETTYKIITRGGRILLYGGAATFFVAGASIARDLVTNQFPASTIAGCTQIFPEAVQQCAKYYAAKAIAASAMGGSLFLGFSMVSFPEDWNPAKNFLKKIPYTFSSKVIDPLKERVLRRNADYVTAMVYGEI